MSDRKIECSSKWRAFYVVLVILGVAGIAAAGVGVVGLGASQGLWSAGILNHLGQINSIVMIVPNAGMGILFLAAGVAGQVREQSYVFSLEEDSIETSEFIEINPMPEETSEFIEINPMPEEERAQKFNEKDLSCFLAALSIVSSSQVNVAGKTYTISYKDSSSTLKIQEGRGLLAKGLEIVLNEEAEIEDILIGDRSKGKKISNIPENYLNVLETGLTTLLQRSSSYDLTNNYFGDGKNLRIGVLRDSIKKIPGFHLQTFTEKMRTTNEFKVRFCTDASGTNDASDAGGPSREYLGLLFDAISESPLFRFIRLPSSLVVPRTKKDYKQGRPLPGITEDEQTRLEQIGEVIMPCFVLNLSEGSKNIGRHFEDSFFKALLCLTADEIDTPFEELTLSTKLKVCDALLTDSEDEAIYTERIELLSKEKLTKTDLTKAAQIACLAECLPDDLVDDDEPNLEKIISEENRERVLQALEDSLFGAKTSLGQLGTQLAPIHAIAKGMKGRCCNPEEDDQNTYWDGNIAAVDFRKFSNRVQGTLSRKDIVENILFDKSLDENQEMEKKIGWLKEWILDEEDGATDEEIRKLLKFVTGSKSLPAGVTIYVDRQREYSPIPRAHTCSYNLELSPISCGKPDGYNDHTKENFIKTLRETVLMDETFGFS